jgi:hypothetical protein
MLAIINLAFHDGHRRRNQNPSGAPGDGPPCIRQRPFGIAGDRQGVPLRVFAPHLGLECMGNRMGLILDFTL